MDAINGVSRPQHRTIRTDGSLSTGPYSTRYPQRCMGTEACTCSTNGAASSKRSPQHEVPKCLGSRHPLMRHTSGGWSPAAAYHWSDSDDTVSDLLSGATPLQMLQVLFEDVRTALKVLRCVSRDMRCEVHIVESP